MTKMDNDALLRPSADVIFRELEGEAVLLDLNSGRYFGLNAAGTRVWTLIASGSTMAQVTAAMAAEFDSDAEQIARDVCELVAELTERGLLVKGAGPASSSP